jgi:hypothetical protein
MMPFVKSAQKYEFLGRYYSFGCKEQTVDGITALAGY